MTLYRVSCEWDMGFSDAYSTREKAEEAIKDADWDLVGMTLQEIRDAGLVGIEEFEVD